MSEFEVSSELKDLLDAYLSGLADESAVARLESLLRESDAARHYFVRYCQLNTDLLQLSRAKLATSAVLEKINLPPESPADATADLRRASPAIVLPHRSWFWKTLGAVAAVALISTTLYLVFNSVQAEPPIAWIKNAQNCRWKSEMAPAGDMKSGKVLELEMGLAEIQFSNDAAIILEGPARIELISSSSARLTSGKLTAQVPKSARGFTIISPQGKVIDLGTEFGISVTPDGGTEIFVFKGEVQALSQKDEKSERNAVSIRESQGAHVESSRVVLQPASGTLAAVRYVREISVPPVRIPRITTLDFSREIPGTLEDGGGLGTGLTHRFPGTGLKLPAHDTNLKLNVALKQLELTTTNSDINRNFHLGQGEYLGFRLSDLGFQRDEDFSITATIPNIPSLFGLGHFGLYAGIKSDTCIRGGLIARSDNSYKLFMANNNGGEDSNAHFIGVQSTGEDMRITLRRLDGKYSLAVENLTTGSESTVSIKHPEFLDAQSDMYVGLFGTNTQSEVPSTLYIKSLSVTVWTLHSAR